MKPEKSFHCIDALKALGEENRINIIRLLLKRQMNVNDLSKELGLPQYNVSKHLRVLREAGLLETVKLGQQRLYDVAKGLREQLQDGPLVLNLGCCTFNFDKID